MRRGCTTGLLAAGLLTTTLVRASHADDPPSAEPATVTIGGYLEAFYQLHAQDPENRITNLRGFDNRSRTFTLANVAVSFVGTRGPLQTRIILQVGHTPSTYYQAEPASPGTSGANESSGELWRYVQTASFTARVPYNLVLEAGLLPSPVGPEVFAIKDGWAWSRSNLFVGLPFYHTGATVSRTLGCGWSAKLHVYNGWNSVVDSNGTPSVGASASFAGGDTSAQLLYLGGIERPSGAAEGTPWRHLFDAYVQHRIVPRLAAIAHGSTGLERNRFGTSAWTAAALHAKVDLHDRLYLAARGDVFREWVPSRDDGMSATSIFWPVEWIASGTLTLGYQPTDGISLRLEARHDQAAGDVFFGGRVASDPVTSTFVPDRDRQDTLTLGVTAWL